MKRVITGWEERLRADGTTEIVEREYLVEDLTAVIDLAQFDIAQMLAATAPTEIVGPTVVTPFTALEERLFMTS